MSKMDKTQIERSGRDYPGCLYRQHPIPPFLVAPPRQRDVVSGMRDNRERDRLLNPVEPRDISTVSARESCVYLNRLLSHR